ncbi:hypothetical protein BB559_003211 [Furculomyces boomerangus]|uniref:Nudix hydrolase 3 n=1 Tax=Furculomyces boomerangus TaxID=61424 RepID=A0A2T9YMQ0_9FUNG|nr:hypothetical protein BB559_003211 [Furculomyces boomerangus]
MKINMKIRNPTKKVSLLFTVLPFFSNAVFGPQGRQLTFGINNNSHFVSTNSTSKQIVEMDLEQRINQYKPTKLSADLSHLSKNDIQAAKKLVKVAKLVDSIYFKQLWKGCLALRDRLESQKDVGKKECLEYKFFMIQRGPWDGADSDKPFIEGVPEMPPGANVYPEDMTKEEFEAFVKTLSQTDKKHATGFYHSIVRNPDGTLGIQKYSEAYKEFLVPAAKLMQEASELVTNESFKRFLKSRGESFLTNEYIKSEVDWLQVDGNSPMEVAVGPYEVYKDSLFASKSFFEIYIHARDFKSTAQLDKFTSSLRYIESRLPVPDNYKNTELKPPTIVVVNQLYSGGDVSVPMTAAYNLPNDEEATDIGGSKLTLIKNVQEGKFKSVLTPISKIVLDESQQQSVDFDAFFTHVLLHEVAHSNGPSYIVSDPKVTVRSRMQEFHSTLEEAKADIVGLFAARQLVENGVIEDVSTEQFYITYLASAFRSIRFGLNEAHGRGQAIQLNFLIDQGGFEYNKENKTFKVNFDKIDKAVERLVEAIILIQGNGDKSAAESFVGKYGINRDYTVGMLESLVGVPVDIQPVWEEL